MRNRLLTSLSALLVSTTLAWGQYGALGQPEMQTYTDAVTGVEITMLTDTARNDRFLYQTDPMWTPDGRYLLFRSSDRSDEMVEYTDKEGKKQKRRATQLYFIDTQSGHIIQATAGTNTGSGFLANRSNKLFINRRVGDDWNLYVTDLDKFFADVYAGKVGKPKQYEQLVGTFPKDMGRPGSYCINSDDDWAYITVERDGTPEEIERMNKNAFQPENNQPVKVKPSLTGIRKMNLATGEVQKVCDLEFKVGHIQASRFRPDEIVFCNETGGDAYQRMWYVKSDGSDLRPLYQETPLDWVTHETFASEDFVYYNVLGFQSRLRKQAHGIFRINLRTNDVDVMGQVETSTPAIIDDRVLNGRGFWHCNATRDNRLTTGDTFAGSVWVIDNRTGHRTQIASDCKMKPDHAQPFFSPDGKRLCFQSGHFTDGRRLTLMMVDLEKVLPADTYADRDEVLRIPYATDRSIYGIISQPERRDGKHGVAIVSHGFNGTHHFARDYFKTLNALGYAVYCFDFPNGSVHSRTDNNTMGMSIEGEKEALKTVVNYFKEQDDVDPEHIVLIGESQGGLVSALTAAELKQQIERMVLIYPALCIPDNWNERYPTIEQIPDTTSLWGVNLSRDFFLGIRDLNVFGTIGQYEGPVLLIHGSADPVVPLSYSERAQGVYRDAQLKVIDKAGHGFKPEERVLSNEFVREFLKQ